MSEERKCTLVKKILKGIDKDEIEDVDGWWETSTGVEFGEKKLHEVEALCNKLFTALNATSYALFQIKRMPGVSDNVVAHIEEAHAKACKVLDECS